MVETWYILLTFMLAMFILLDGWNIGVGVLHYRLGPTDHERREVIRALGSSWSWNEVWLIAFGGCLFLSFPKAYAAYFSGFYLAFFLLLWCFILRGLAIELGHVIDDRLWRSFWDAMLRFSSVLLALLIGIASGNVVRGLPLDADGWFALPFFTHLGVHGDVGLLDWYTISAGIFTLVTLAAHGAGYAALTASGTVRDRASRIAPRLWVLAVLLLVVMACETIAVRPEFMRAMSTRPLGLLGFLVIAAGVGGLVVGHRGARTGLAFAGGCAAITGVISNGAVGLFPTMLPSTGAGQSRTVFELAATEHNLLVALPWWTLATMLAIGYLVFIVRHQRARHENKFSRSAYPKRL